MSEKVTRKEILEASIHNTCGDRDIQYGSPENSFAEIAKVWSWWLGTPITSVDAAIMLSLFKHARMKTGYGKADNFVDAAGYIACAGELADISKMSSGEIEKKIVRKDLVDLPAMINLLRDRGWTILIERDEDEIAVKGTFLFRYSFEGYTHTTFAKIAAPYFGIHCNVSLEDESSESHKEDAKLLDAIAKRMRMDYEKKVKYVDEF